MTLTEFDKTDEANLPIYLQPHQLAELRGCSERTLAREREAGAGPKFVKLGRKILYRRATVVAWMAEQEVESVAEAKRRERERGRK